MAERRDRTRPQRMLGAIQGAVQLLGLDECQLLSPVDFLKVVFSSRVRQSKGQGLDIQTASLDMSALPFVS